MSAMSKLVQDDHFEIAHLLYLVDFDQSWPWIKHKNHHLFKTGRQKLPTRLALNRPRLTHDEICFKGFVLKLLY